MGSDISSAVVVLGVSALWCFSEGLRPGFVGFQRWVFLEGWSWRVGFFEKFGGTLGGAGVMTERFAPVKWRVAEEWG